MTGQGDRRHAEPPTAQATVGFRLPPSRPEPLHSAVYRAADRALGVPTPPPAGLPTPLWLSAAVWTLEGGDLVLIGAPTLGGTTSFVVSLSLDIAADGQPVLFASLDHHPTEIGRRFLSCWTGIMGGRLGSGNLDEKQHQIVRGAAIQLEALPIWIWGDRSLDGADLRAGADETVKSWDRRGIIVIDHLERLIGQDLADGAEAELEATLAAIKILACDLNLCVLATTRLTSPRRGPEERRRALSDLVHPSLAKAADIVLILHPGDAPGMGFLDDRIEEIIVEKDRHGERGLVPAAFDPRTGRWGSPTLASTGEKWIPP